MFLFKSLHKGNRKIFALAVMFCLSAALLFTGCEQESENENTGFIPVGEWTAQWDGYIITNTSVEYGEFKGTIEKAIDFSANAGVLIIKINESSGDFTVNKYTGVYYSEYTSTSIKLANVWLEDSNGEWYPLQSDSLSAAVSLFSVDTVNDHVSYWGVYTKE